MIDFVPNKDLVITDSLKDPRCALYHEPRTDSKYQLHWLRRLIQTWMELEMYE